MASGAEALSRVHARCAQDALAGRMLDDRDQLAVAAKVRTTMTFLGHGHLCDHDPSGLVGKLSDQAVDKIQQLLSCLLTGCRDGFAHPSIAPHRRGPGHSHDRPLTGGVTATTAREVGPAYGALSSRPIRKKARECCVELAPRHVASTGSNRLGRLPRAPAHPPPFACPTHQMVGFA